ncbi:hypothetical protein T03_3494 [Trichinella britovi]|uniref:Uncharacterized protein n=1 Tax=Trichinella britovi TaxID=45882 RepID=A0A0V1CPB6_TRIBR|nr:hypothetical protein T03_3494 [Trichinella britovi]
MPQYSMYLSTSSFVWDSTALMAASLSSTSRAQGLEKSGCLSTRVLTNKSFEAPSWLGPQCHFSPFRVSS